MLTLQALRQLESFSVKLKGKAQESYPTGSPCIYFEWVYGEKNGDNWALLVKGWQSSEDLTLITEAGEVKLGLNQLRLYLAPAYARTFSDLDAPAAPEVVRQMMHAERKPITVEEYRLSAGQTYYARVAAESYWLPPAGDKPPARHTNLVLAISDAPFVKDEPQRPLTPAYQGWSY